MDLFNMKKIFWLITLIFSCATNFIAQEVAGNSKIPPLKIIEQGWFEEDAVKSVKIMTNGIDETTAIPLIRKQFVYKATLLNETGKIIKGLVWAYIFLDQKNNSELKRHNFVNHSKLKINEQKTIKGVSDSRPSNIINIKSLEDKKKSQYAEKVEVECVIFDDNSTWEAKDEDKIICQKLFNKLSNHKPN